MEEWRLRCVKLWRTAPFLPAWAKDTVYRENQILRAKLDDRDREIREQNAYIDGLETALRSMRRIVIQNGVK